MIIEIKQSTPNFIQLVLFNINQPFSNLIRRYLISKVKTVQILGVPYSLWNQNPSICNKVQDYEFRLNTFKFVEHNLDYNSEQIQFQIQNIPLNFNVKQIQNFNQEDYIFKIDAFNDTKQDLMITSGDIKVYDKFGEMYPLNIIRNIFQEDFFQLFLIKPQQKIKFEATAILSDSSTHAVFNHISNLQVTPCINNDKADKQLKKILSNSQDLKQRPGNQMFPDSSLQITTDFNTCDRFRCFDTNQFNLPFNFDISFNTISSLPPTYALYQVFCKAISDLQDLSNNLNIILETHYHCQFYIPYDISIGFVLQYNIAIDMYSNNTQNKIPCSITFASFEHYSRIFRLVYSQKMNIDTIQNQLKQYIQKTIITLNKLKEHFSTLF